MNAGIHGLPIRGNGNNPWDNEKDQFSDLHDIWFKHEKQCPENDYEYYNSLRIYVTTIGSIIISIMFYDTLKTRANILKEIHDFWVLTTKTCLSDFPEILEERSRRGQFDDFDSLSPEEQNKDAIFLDTIVKHKEIVKLIRNVIRNELR